MKDLKLNFILVKQASKVVTLKDGLIEGDVWGPEEFECAGGGRLD